MALLVQSEVRPGFPDLFDGQMSFGLSGKRKAFSCPVNSILSLPDNPVERVGVDEVFQSPVERCVAFGFSGSEQVKRRLNLPRVVNTSELELSDVFHERFGDLPFGPFRGDRNRVGAGIRVLSNTGFAPVVESTSGSLVGFHGVPAGGAPDDSGKQTGRSAGSAGSNSLSGVRGLECGPVDNGLVAFKVDDALTAVDFSEVGSVSDHVPDGTYGPRSGGLVTDPFRDFRPGVAGGPSVEGFLDDAAFRAGVESPGVVFGVAKRNGPSDIDASLDGVGAGDEPRFALPVNLELSDGAHYGGDHASGPSAGVNAFRDGEEGGIVFCEEVEEFSEVGDGSAEPVEFRDHDPFGFTGFDSLDGLVESGPVSFLAGLVEILENFEEGVLVETGPAFDSSPLFNRRDKSFPLTASYATDTNIAVNAHFDALSTGKIGDPKIETAPASRKRPGARTRRRSSMLESLYNPTPGSCVDCGEGLPKASRTTRKYCTSCRTIKDRELKRESKRRLRDATEDRKFALCVECGNSLPEPHDRRRSLCSDECRAARLTRQQRAWRKANPEKCRAAFTRWASALRDEIRTYKADGCIECGETDPVVLDFHHLGDKSFTIGSSISISRGRQKTLSEIKKCVVLCSNCHRRLHARGKNA